MKSLIYSSVLFGLILNTNYIKAQEADTRKSFLLTGVSVNIPKGNNLSVYGGVSTSEEHTQMFHGNAKYQTQQILYIHTPLYIFEITYTW